MKSSGLGMAGMLAGHSAAASLASWIKPPIVTASSRFRYAIVNAASPESEEGVEVLAPRGKKWHRQHFVPSASPSSLAVSPDGRTLFVANRIAEFRSLPTGSVESWSIDQVTGRLLFLSRQGLALAATLPSDLAVSVDGRTLAVLAEEGTMYTVLPVSAHGELGEAAAVRKEIGSSPGLNGASPQSAKELCFARSGELLAADLGEKTLSTFACSPGQITLIHRESLSLAARVRFLRARTLAQADRVGPAKVVLWGRA